MIYLHFSSCFKKVPLPEEPDTQDEAEIRKWKWKLKAAKKENSERHSQRCDIELKLAVRIILVKFNNQCYWIL